MPSNPSEPNRDADSHTAPTRALRRQITEAVEASLAEIRAELADLAARQRHMADLLENLTRAVADTQEELPAAPEKREETELPLWPTDTAGPKGAARPENRRPKESRTPASEATDSRKSHPEDEEELPLDLPLSTWPPTSEPPPPPAPEKKAQAADRLQTAPDEPAPKRQEKDASSSNGTVSPKEVDSPFRPVEAVGETAAEPSEEEPYGGASTPSTAPLLFPAKNGGWSSWQAHPYLRGFGLVAVGLILLAGVLWSISRPLSTDPVNPARYAKTFRPAEPLPGTPRQGETVAPLPSPNKGTPPPARRFAPGPQDGAADIGKPRASNDGDADAPRDPAPDPMPAETAVDPSPNSLNSAVGENPAPFLPETSKSEPFRNIADARVPADEAAMTLADRPKPANGPLRPPLDLASAETDKTASAKTEEKDAGLSIRTEPFFPETTNETAKETPSVAPAPPRRPFTLLLATLRSRRQVRLARTEYRQMGMEPFWTEVDLEKRGVWYRVFWGHFETEAAARQKKEAAGLAAAMVKQARWTAAVGTAETDEADRLRHRVTAQTPWMAYTMAAQGNRQRVCVGAFYTEEGARLQCRKLQDQGMDCTVEKR